MIEIERKFLVLSDQFKKEADKTTFISQGFLSTDPDRTVRVRLKGEIGFLTIKGQSNASGTSRQEWEYEIPATEARELLELCPVTVEKFRYEIRAGKHLFEVDEFLGLNSGLVVAEIELNREDEQFERPVWLGKEVTGLVKYYNAQLAQHPFCHWSVDTDQN